MDSEIITDKNEKFQYKLVDSKGGFLLNLNKMLKEEIENGWEPITMSSDDLISGRGIDSRFFILFRREVSNHYKEYKCHKCGKPSGSHEGFPYTRQQQIDGIKCKNCGEYVVKIYLENILPNKDNP